MTAFGDPATPRRNLWGGLVLTAFGALLMGLAFAELEAAPAWPGAYSHAWIQLALGALFVFAAVMQFRLGLRSARFPSPDAVPDSPQTASDTSRTGRRGRWQKTSDSWTVAQNVAIGAAIFVALQLFLRFGTAAPALPRAESRNEVARAVAETLGEAGDAAKPEVGFMQDYTHLLVQLRTVAFRTVTDDELTRQSRYIARTALNSYDHPDQLDSISVLYRERARESVWWVRHVRTFHVSSLADVPRQQAQP